MTASVEESLLMVEDSLRSLLSEEKLSNATHRWPIHEYKRTSGSCFVHIPPGLMEVTRSMLSRETQCVPIHEYKKTSGACGMHKDIDRGQALKIDDRSTAIGSEDSDELDDICSTHEDHAEEDEDEEGAKEEAEFSLDGRLASRKKWRRFQAISAEAGTALPIQEPPFATLLSERNKPGGLSLASVHGTVTLRPPPGLCGEPLSNAPSPQLPLPPGLCGATVQPPMSSRDFNLLNINGSVLLEAAMPELAAQIGLLSQRSLGADTWEALLNPEPEDPEWQLLALVGKDCLAGFAKYAFFREDREDGSEGTIMSIHHVVVDEVLRGMGHGRTMLINLLSRAQAANAWAIKLYSTAAAVGFYERLGFKLVGPDRLMERKLLLNTAQWTSTILQAR